MIDKMKPLKIAQRAFYKGRLTKFKRVVALMIALGIVFALLYFVKYIYNEYASAYSPTPR